jgi:hypothetical protein
VIPAGLEKLLGQRELLATTTTNNNNNNNTTKTRQVVRVFDAPSYKRSLSRLVPLEKHTHLPVLVSQVPAPEHSTSLRWAVLSAVAAPHIALPVGHVLLEQSGPVYPTKQEHKPALPSKVRAPLEIAPQVPLPEHSFGHENAHATGITMWASSSSAATEDKAKISDGCWMSTFLRILVRVLRLPLLPYDSVGQSDDPQGVIAAARVHMRRENDFLRMLRACTTAFMK